MRTTPKMNLTSWDQLPDVYNFAQLAANWQIIDFHDHSPGRGVAIPAGGLGPGAVLSSNIAANTVGPQHLSLTTLQNLGLNQAGSTGRGYTPIATAQTTTSPTYTLLSTPDQVSSITLTTGGLMAIGYQATWSNGSTNASNAAIFLNSVQLQAVTSSGTGALAPQSASGVFAANIATVLTSWSGGLGSGVQGVGSAYSDATTGQTLTSGGNAGGMCWVFAAPGTYNVSVQFKTSAGTLTVQNRKLWVWTVNFN